MRAGAWSIAVGLMALVFAGALGAAGSDCPWVTLPAQAAESAALANAGFDIAPVPVDGVDVNVPTVFHACLGEIRPGAHMTSPVGCTFSWIFRDQAGTFYQTTAGHCTSLGQRVSAQGVGAFGTTIFSTGNGGQGKDISMIRIDADKAHLVNPTLCHWGGPSGIATPPVEPGEENVMLHYGWGTAFSSQPTRARVGIVEQAGESSGWFSDGSVRMIGATDGGDSGSPMMLANGLAAGVHTHRNGPMTYFGSKIATRLDVWIPRIESALAVDLQLVEGLPVDLTGLGID